MSGDSLQLIEHAQKLRSLAPPITVENDMDQRKQEPNLKLSQPNHLEAILHIAGHLWDHHRHTSHLLIDEVEAIRKNVGLDSLDDDAWDEVYDSIAVVMMSGHKYTGHDAYLELAARLGCDDDQPSRYFWLAQIAYDQYTRQTDVTWLEERIYIQRRALLQFPPHDLQFTSYSQLADSLLMLYGETEDEHFLIEAIVIERNSIKIQSPGARGYHLAQGRLAQDLCILYDRVGDIEVLEEALALARNSLDGQDDKDTLLAPVRAHLAKCLEAQFRRLNTQESLDEAITLRRAVLNQRWDGYPNHPSRIEAILALASPLTRTNDSVTLNEAIDLQTTALHLLKPHDPNYAAVHGALADSLYLRFIHNHDESVLPQIYDLCHKTIGAKGLGVWAWRSRVQLAYLHLIRETPYYSVSTAIQLVGEATQLVAYSYSEILSIGPHILRLSQSHSLDGADLNLLISAYTNLVAMLPSVADYALNRRSQLESLADLGKLGSEAFQAAVLAGYVDVGIELLDNARATMWAQALAGSNPDLAGVPEYLGTELRSLFAVIKEPVVEAQSDDPNVSLYSVLTNSDIRHRASTRIRSLLIEIRALPGQSHFMLGSTHDILMQTAARHPVVILVVAEHKCYATMIRAPHTPPLILKLNIQAPELRKLSVDIQAPHSRSQPLNECDEIKVVPGDDRRGMKTSLPQSKSNRSLALIWQHIVKPVIQNLGLKASKNNKDIYELPDDRDKEGCNR
jgi:hypothetical protein